jgi:hypothetical protein
VVAVALFGVCALLLFDGSPAAGTMGVGGFESSPPTMVEDGDPSLLFAGAV